jgi:hypothetical protein
VARKNKNKIVQFTIVLHLLQQGHLMLGYESLKPLFEFLAMPKKQQKTFEFGSSWTTIEFMHQVTMRATKW